MQTKGRTVEGTWMVAGIWTVAGISMDGFGLHPEWSCETEGKKRGRKTITSRYLSSAHKDGDGDDDDDAGVLSICLPSYHWCLGTNQGAK